MKKVYQQPEVEIRKYPVMNQVLTGASQVETGDPVNGGNGLEDDDLYDINLFGQ